MPRFIISWVVCFALLANLFLVMPQAKSQVIANIGDMTLVEVVLKINQWADEGCLSYLVYKDGLILVMREGRGVATKIFAIQPLFYARQEVLAMLRSMVAWGIPRVAGGAFVEAGGSSALTAFTETVGPIALAGTATAAGSTVISTGWIILPLLEGIVLVGETGYIIYTYNWTLPAMDKEFKKMGLKMGQTPEQLQKEMADIKKAYEKADKETGGYWYYFKDWYVTPFENLPSGDYTPTMPGM